MVEKIRLAVCLVAFWATSLSVSGESFELIDANSQCESHGSTVECSTVQCQPDPFPLGQCNADQDRWFLVSTRHLPYQVCQTPVENPPLEIRQVDGCKNTQLDIEQYQSMLSCDRPVMMYVHGNRMDASNLMSRCSQVFSQIRGYRRSRGIDWVIFSWPSAKLSSGISDFRIKASRCDSQAFYLAWLMRRHAQRSVPMGILAYSFGCRIASGALHLLAGGQIRGVSRPEVPLLGLQVKVGMVAPALESTWLAARGRHGLATQNMDELVLLYNHRDAVLKRYWLIERVRRATALGYSGPTSFGPRFDGSRLPVQSRDCAPSVKLRHSEVDYYKSSCNAGCDFSRLINGLQPVAF